MCPEIAWKKWLKITSSQALGIIKMCEYIMIQTSFNGNKGWVNRRFVSSFENEGDRKVHTGYYLPKLEIKDCNVMIDGKSFFDQPVKTNVRTYDNIRKISTGPADDHTAGCLLGYNYFKEHYKMIAIVLSKQ